MLNIIGTYHCKADNKGRIMMPADLKKQLAPVVSDGFVVKRAVFQPCLELYPMKEWNEMMMKVNKLNRFVKKNNDFIRRFTAGVKTVEIDAAGRLLIPKDLLVFSKIEKEIVTQNSYVPDANLKPKFYSNYDKCISYIKKNTDKMYSKLDTSINFKKIEYGVVYLLVHPTP